MAKETDFIGYKKSSFACPIALHNLTAAVGALTS